MKYQSRIALSLASSLLAGPTLGADEDVMARGEALDQRLRLQDITAMAGAKTM